jgi:3-dehydroquinate dehydratase I
MVNALLSGENREMLKCLTKNVNFTRKNEFPQKCVITTSEYNNTSVMICTSIGNADFDTVLEKAKTEELIELRLDLLELTDAQVKSICSQNATIIATCRPGKLTEDQRLGKIKQAILAGARLVDTEWDAGDEFIDELVPFARGHQCRVIISFHDKEKTPVKRELEQIVKECSMSGADIVKIVCKVNSREDNARILSLYSLGKNIIALGLGNLGKITRIAAPLIGAEFTYASLGKGLETADGQMSKNTMERAYKTLGQL